MEHPYQKFFGLKGVPFNITPDPSFFYESSGHREAFAQLRYGIEARKGFIVLTGEVGTGKTTVIHTLLEQLRGKAHTALIFSMITHPRDLLRAVCEEFGLIEPKQPLADMHDYLALLNDFLLQNYRGGTTCALIIDEAQNLPNEVLENIRLLSNFETSTDKLLQILLVGQPELAARLNSPELRQLKQRITLRNHLGNLSQGECCDYVANRLRCAGGDSAIFTAAALEAVFTYSGGIPRLINILCDNAMLTSYALSRNPVDRDIIREVARDLHLEAHSVPLTVVEKKRVPPLARVKVAQNGNLRAAVSLPQPPNREPGSNGVEAFAARPSKGRIAPVGFFEVLSRALTEAMGPMAPIVIRDEIRNLGESSETFPLEKLEKLVELVSREILDDSMKDKFQRGMGAVRSSTLGLKTRPGDAND